MQVEELSRLRLAVRDYELFRQQHEMEVQSLKQDLRDARVEQQHIEDELELKRQEIDALTGRLQEAQKSGIHFQKLAENEVYSLADFVLIR